MISCPLGQKTEQILPYAPQQRSKQRNNKTNTKNESNYQRHTGEHNNKSNNQHRRKIIAQLSPQRQTFYNLHDMRHIHCNNCLYRHNIKTAQNRPSPTKPPCSAHFPAPPTPKKAQKTAEIRRFQSIAPHKSP